MIIINGCVNGTDECYDLHRTVESEHTGTLVQLRRESEARAIDFCPH